jgi:hypothetical protein
MRPVPSRWLLTPCALRLREPHLTARPLTPFLSPDGATARAPSPAFAACATRLSPGGDASRRTEDPARQAVGLARRRSKPRTPSIGSMLDLATEWSVCAIPVTFSRTNRSAPFSPDTTKLASSETEPPCRATSRHRSRPWGDSRGREDDASHRLLQPTYDTCTRGPHDSRTWRLSPSLTCAARSCDPTSPSALSALRVACAALPFGSAAPSRCALDGAHRASVPSLTAARSFLKGAEHRSGRCSLHPSFVGRGQGWQRTPLTLPVALREYPGTRTSSRRTRTAFSAITSTMAVSTAQSAFYRQVLSPNETRFRETRSCLV